MIFTDGSEMLIPENAVLLTDNHVSAVYRWGKWIYKRSIPFLIENELYFLGLMQGTGFVPRFTRYDKYTLRIEDLGESDYVYDVELFRRNMYILLETLKQKGIRHGDITNHSIIVKKDWPYLIDFAESRMIDDPRPDKRKEGDRYWIERTIDALTPTIEI